MRAQRGEMAERIAAFDWSRSPLGPRENWSPALRTSLDIALASRFPMILWWGPELVVLYNDAYLPMLGSKHPGALGQPGMSPDAWGDPEVRRVIEPMLRGVLERGDATWSEDQLLILERDGFPEETYFTWSYSPIREDGAIVGVFTAVSETTRTVIGARRLRVLSELTAATFEAPSVDEACGRAGAVLTEQPYDIPFHLIYLFDGNDRQACSGTEHIAAAVNADRSLGEALLAGIDNDVHIVDLADWNWLVPSGVWPEPVERAVLLPLVGSGQQRRLGCMVAGLSPRLALTSEYKAFVELLASRIASAIVDARALEDERTRAEALAALDRSKSMFFSNVSHEFRTPLTLILGPLGDALREGAGAQWELQAERIATARGNGLRLLKLVNSLLDFSRIDAGRARASLAPTDASTVTRHLIGVFGSAFAAAGLELDVDIEEFAELVDIDVEMWETIVFNLLSNALKYTHAGRVGVSLCRRDDMIELAVADTGVGIDGSKIDLIFDRFYRGDGPTGRSLEGTGIGLALVRELVHLHDGTISAESAPGAGSTFTVRVPFRASGVIPGTRPADAAMSVQAQSFFEEARRWVSDDDDDTAADGAGRDEPVAPDERARVLVVDDHAEMRRYLHGILSDRWTVEVAANGREALDAARRRRPDAIVSDVMMPILDGIALLEEVRADRALRDTPVLLLSARAGAEATLDGFAHGADDYIIKPFSPRELVARVQVLLDAGRRHGAAAEREHARRQIAEGITALATSLNTANDMDQVAQAIYAAIGRFGGLVGVTLSVAEPDESVTRQYFAGTTVPGDLAARYLRTSIDIDTPHTRAMRLGQPLLFETADQLLDDFPGSAPDFVRLGVASGVALPMCDSSGDAFGCISLGWDRATTFDAQRITALEDVTEIVARSVERIEVQQLERHVAQTLQLGLLTLDVRTTHAVIRARYRASDATMEVGGDWYDVVELAGNRIGVAVGDVVGRGLPAATTMGQLRAALGASMLQTADPVDAIDVLERFAERLPGARCSTAAVAIVDPVREHLRYCSAGHPPPLLVTPDGRVEVLGEGRSWPLVVDASRGRPDSATARFPAGSLLLLYTDGLIERRGEPITAGIERLMRVVGEGWNLPVAHLHARIFRYLVEGERAGRDDIALVALRTNVAAPRLFADVIRARTHELRGVRRRLARWLEEQPVPDEAIPSIMLAVGEACANAVDHGSRGDESQPVRVEAAVRDDELIVTVTDSGDWQTGLEGFLSGRGRGHTLMHALVDEVEVDNDQHGTAVTLRLKLTGVSA